VSLARLRLLSALRLGLFLALGLTSTSLVWASGPSYVADVFFARNSSDIPRDQYANIERLACMMLSRKLEVFIAVGYTAKDEKNPQALSEERAQKVKDRFIALGLIGHFEVFGQAQNQPVADNATLEGRAKNRRVEVEIRWVRDGSKGGENCEPLWKSQFLALSGDKAMVVARYQVREGWVKPVEPFLLALSAARLDLLAALLQPDSTISLNAKDRRAVFSQALASKALPAVRMLLDAGIRPDEFPSLEEPLLLACRAGSGVEIASLLLERGAKVQSSQALECAVSRDIALVSLFLQAGANQYLSPKAVVASGRRPEILEILLNAGANPLSRTRCGETLFHSVRLQTPEQVKRLLDFGLDINAKGHPYDCHNQERSALQQALSYAPVAVLDFMVNAGARIDHESIPDFDWSHAPMENLIWAIRHDIKTARSPDMLGWLATDKAKIPVMEALLASDVDINSKDSRGETALARAIKRYQSDVVQYLVRHGADVQWVAGPASKKQSALELAQDLSVFMPMLICSWGCAPVSATAEPPKPLPSPGMEAAKAKILQILQENR
jgi:ankyrin repeat protein